MANCADPHQISSYEQFDQLLHVRSGMLNQILRVYADIRKKERKILRVYADIRKKKERMSTQSVYIYFEECVLFYFSG